MDINLNDISVDYLFKIVSIGVNEEVIIEDIDYINSSSDLYQHVLVSNGYDDIKLIFDYGCFKNNIGAINIGDAVSVIGILRLDTEDLFYVEVSEILNHVSCDKYDNQVDLEDDISRNDSEVAIWRQKVISRDKVCRCCGVDKTKYLEAHHIFSWNDYPALRTNVDNGVTLCKWCHHKYNSYFGHKGTAIGIVDFIERFGIHKR